MFQRTRKTMTKTPEIPDWESRFEEVYPLEYNCRLYFKEVKDFIRQEIQKAKEEARREVFNSWDSWDKKATTISQAYIEIIKTKLCPKRNKQP